MIGLAEERTELRVPEEATSLLARIRIPLQQQNVECYIVGGFVRDGLLGRTNHDLDLAVGGDALGIAARVSSALGTRMIPLNEANQVARIVLSAEGSRWNVDFAGLRGGIGEDLHLRDFTINAMAIDFAHTERGLSQAPVIDPLGGRRDLSGRTVRAASSTSFRDDPARLLRAVRFAAALDFSIDPETSESMKRDCSLIKSVAAERIRDELCYILECPRAYDALRLLEELGLLIPMVPELSVTEGVTQPKEHYWNVFDHSLETVDAVERVLRERDFREDDPALSLVPWSAQVAEHVNSEIGAGRSRKALLKLAALLHDLGKPATRTIEADGRMRFLGHAREGAETAAQLIERLRFSNRETKMVRLMVEHHMRPGYLAREGTPSRRAVYRFFRDTGDVGIETLLLGLADHLAARGPALDLDEWGRHCETTGYVLASWFHERETVSPPKLIDGHVLIEKFGLEPGPLIGELLELVREAQAEGEVDTVGEALELVEKRLRSGTE